MLLRNAGKLCSVQFHQLFIGSTYTDAFFQCQGGKLICGTGSAHGLTDDFDLRIIQDRIKIVDHAVLIRISRKLTQIQDILYVQTGSALLQKLCIGTDDFRNTAAYRAVSQNGYICHTHSYFLRCFKGLNSTYKILHQKHN